MSSGQRAFAAFVKTLGILFTVLLLATITAPALATPDIRMSDSSRPEAFTFDVTVHNRGVLDITPFKLTIKFKIGQTVLSEKSVTINVPAGETTSQKLVLTLTEDDVKRTLANQSEIGFDANIGYRISVVGYTLMTINISQKVSQG